jgi:hypothetical protein
MITLKLFVNGSYPISLTVQDCFDETGSAKHVLKVVLER